MSGPGPSTSHGPPAGPSSASNPVEEAGAQPLEMTRINLGGEIVEIPALLIASESAFRSVITKDVFKDLSEEKKKYLQRFLPSIPEETGVTADDVLDGIFTDDNNFYFGNTIQFFHQKLRGGWFNPDRPSDKVQLRDNNKVLYDHYIRFYYIDLLKKLLVTRDQIFEHYSNVPPGEVPGPLPVDPFLIKKQEVSGRLKSRAHKRARLMINDCKFKVGENGKSSDEDEPPPKTALHSAGRSTLYSPHYKDMDLHQPTQIDDIKTMLKQYKQLKKIDPNSPSLDISDIRLEDVYERAGVQSVSDRIQQSLADLQKE